MIEHKSFAHLLLHHMLSQGHHHKQDLAPLDSHNLHWLGLAARSNPVVRVDIDHTQQQYLLVHKQLLAEQKADYNQEQAGYLAADKPGQSQARADYTHHWVVQNHTEDSFVAWEHLMHMGIVAEEAHLDHMTGLLDLDMVLLVDWLEDHMFGVLVTACHMMAAYHTAAVGHIQVEDLTVHILAEKTQVLRKDAELGYDFHTSLHIHVHSYADEQLGNRVDVNNLLDHEAVHNYNLTELMTAL